MQDPTIITHLGQKILYLDFSHFTLQNDGIEAGQKILNKAKVIIAAQQPGSMLTLTKVERSEFDTEVVKRLQKFITHNKPYVRRAAIVGLEGIQKSVFQALTYITQREIKAFDTVSQAKSYLVDPPVTSAPTGTGSSDEFLRD